jgi:hypothetical protein
MANFVKATYGVFKSAIVDSAVATKVAVVAGAATAGVGVIHTIEGTSIAAQYVEQQANSFLDVLDKHADSVLDRIIKRQEEAARRRQQRAVAVK